MTSTITAGTLTITITESVTLTESESSSDKGLSLTSTVTVGSVANVVHRIVTIPTTKVGLLAFAATLIAAPAGSPQNTYVAGHHAEGDVRYVRITNLDDTNHVTLVCRSASGAEFAVLVDAGHSWFYGCDQTGGTAASLDASATALTVSLEDLEDITAQASTGDVDLEVVVASV